MLIEMTIKGLMVDPVTNMPIVILRDEDKQRVLPIWVGVVRGQRDRAADRERRAAAADDARPAAQPHRRARRDGREDRRLRPEGEHVLRADLPRASTGKSWRWTRGRATRSRWRCARRRRLRRGDGARPRQVRRRRERARRTRNGSSGGSRASIRTIWAIQDVSRSLASSNCHFQFPNWQSPSGSWNRSAIIGSLRT